MLAHQINDCFYPNPFPPTWAESWGEDEYGLFADLVLHSAKAIKPDTFIKKTVQLLRNDIEKESISITQRFRWIASGDFLMGSPEDEPERFDDEQQHKVTLTRGYWLADTAVSQAFWLFLMGGNPAYFKDDANNPVGKVSWNDCQSFISKLNQQLSGQLDSLVYRLPTESEWEHACRAGTTTPFSFGENITSEQVNFDGSRPYNKGKKSEGRNKTVAVKSLPPNQWGLYAMHGNVWEWCADAWQEQWGMDAMIDPCHSGYDDARRLRRGGSWADGGWFVRSAYRDCRSPGSSKNVGLRLALGQELHARSAKQ